MTADARNHQTTLVAVGKASGRRCPDRVEAPDLAFGATATFRFSKLVSRNVVTVDEPRGSGARRTIGE